MEFDDSGSIHDIDSAPEAPRQYSLSSLELSPISNVGSPRTGRQTASFYLAKSPPTALMPPLLHDDDEEVIMTRERSDTAPGRLDYIDEIDSSQFTMTSSGNIRKRTRSGSDGLQEFGSDSDPASIGDQSVKDNQALEPEEGFETMYYWCGIPLPWCNWGYGTRASSCLARHAPCFWFCGEKLTTGATDRSILYRLNILSAFLAFIMMAASSFLWFVLEADFVIDRSTTVEQKIETGALTLNLWNLNGNVFALGILSALIFFVSLCTLKIVTEVNLRGAVRYLWILVWVMPVQIFYSLSLVDYHKVSSVWIRHWWGAPSMAWFRRRHCEEGTANTLCIVPIDGGFIFETEDEWCDAIFESTACTEIRDDAQNAMEDWIVIFYSCCAVWGSLMTILIYLTICMLEGIITKPIVQASRESNAPAWMFVPIVGCFCLGAVFLFNASSIFEGGTRAHVWVGALYVIGGGLFFISAMLGWFTSNYSILNSSDKRNKHFFVICHIVVNVFTAVLMISIFFGSVFSLVTTLDNGMTNTERGRAACSIDTAGSCTWCDNRIGASECPEYSDEEVIKVIQVQYKASASLALIFVLYATTSLRFGCVLKKNIALYQIDFV